MSEKENIDSNKILIQEEITTRQGRETISSYATSNHKHNGADSPFIDYSSIQNKQQILDSHVFGTAAANAANYGAFFIAPFQCSVLGMYESHGQAGTDAGDVLLGIRLLRPGQTFATQGRIITVFNLKTTANVPIPRSLRKGAVPAILRPGDRLALDTNGTLTDVADVTVTVLIQY